MADILIRNLDPATVKRLKERAKRHGRSLQSEVRLVLERVGGVDGSQMTEVLAKWRKKFAGRKFSSSVEMIRQDRRR